MADYVVTIASERWLDEVLILGTIANPDGARADTMALPPTLGEVAIMKVGFEVAGIDTLMTTPENNGPMVWVVASAAINILDIVGTNRWNLVYTNNLATVVTPDELVLWKPSERLYITMAETDTAATPTGDLSVFVKVVRVRPQAGSPGPVKLVR